MIEVEQSGGSPYHLVAKVDGKLAGALTAQPADSYGYKAGSYIRTIEVLPEFRRKGVGRALLNHAMETLPDPVELKVQPFSRDRIGRVIDRKAKGAPGKRDLKRFYRSAGFTGSGEYMKALKEGVRKAILENSVFSG